MEDADEGVQLDATEVDAMEEKDEKKRKRRKSEVVSAALPDSAVPMVRDPRVHNHFC